MILAAGVLGASMGIIDGTVVSLAMAAIRADLGVSLDQATWINNAYMVTLSALILSGSAFADRFGLGRIFTIGVTLFISMSLICALAPTPQILIGARLAQGTGAALIIPCALAMVSRAYPRDMRVRAISIWAAASAVTTAIGPVIAGLALSIAGPEVWRLIFAINLPFGVIALILVRMGVQTDTRNPARPLDIRGAALAVMGLGLLAWMLTHLEGPDTTPIVWLTGLAGLAAMLAFLLQEARTRFPMMPLSLFADRTFSAANATTFALYFGLSAILFFLPMLTIAGWGISEIETAIAFAPMAIFIALLSTRFGRLADRIGPGSVIAMGAMTVAIGYGALALVIPLQNFWFAVLPAMTISGLGMSMVVAPVSATVMGSVYDHQSGVASGVNNALSRIAGLMAVAAMGTLISFAYDRAGGTFSYGETLADAGHVAAMGTALTAIAWVASGLCLLASVIAYLGIPRGGAAPRETG